MFIISLTAFLLLIEFFTLLFVKTGLSYEKSRFQVISMLSTVGFTTKESEYITKNSQRRKIASWVIILGYISNITFVSFIINLLTNYTFDYRAFILFAFFLILIICIRSYKIIHFIDKILEKAINRKVFSKFYSKYKTVMESKQYAIYIIKLDKGSFLINKQLENSGLKLLYNIQVLMVKNGEKQINCPNSNYIFKENDEITIYGEIKEIEKLFLK